MKIKFKYLLLFCVFLLNTPLLIASNPQEKQADSLIKVAENGVYKNSDEAITTALSIFNNSSYSAKIRSRALIVVSTGYSSKRDYKKALEYIIKAKEFSSQIDDEELQIVILFAAGLQYQQLKIYDKAIESMEEVEKKVLAYPQRDSIGKVLADSYLVKGFIYKDNLNCDIALEYFNKGIKEYERIGNCIYNLSIGYYNKGNCYISLSEYANAKESFNKAMELARQKNASSLVSFAEKGLAEVYSLEGKHQVAITLLQSAINRSKDVGDLVLNSGIYKGLYENNLALNKLDEYQKYYDLYLKVQLEIIASERNSVSVSINESSKNLNKNLNHIQSKFKDIFNLTILGISIFIMFVFLLKRKNKKIVKTLQKKIESYQYTKPTPKIK